MNKMFLAGCFLLLGFGVFAADLTLPDGRVFKHTEIKSCMSGFVVIEYENGEGRIALNDLPENFIAALNTRQRSALRNGADLHFSDGRVYKNCIVKKMGNNALTLKHNDGTAVVPFKDLPRNYQALFTAKQLSSIANSKTTAVSAGKVIGKTTNGKIVYTGPRGGRYVITDAGRKRYLSKDADIIPVDSVKSNAGQQ